MAKKKKLTPDCFEKRSKQSGVNFFESIA